MAYDKKLTGVIVFIWLITVLLILNFASTVQNYDKPYEPQPIKKDTKDQRQLSKRHEETITVHVIANNDSFCGHSTEGKCTSDADCAEGGCSGQICQSKSGESAVSTCEWKECYNNEKYGLSCQCVNNQCQWK